MPLETEYTNPFEEDLSQLRRRRPNQTSFKMNPASLYRRIGAYLENNRMARTDQLAERFGCGVPTVRTAVQALRTADPPLAVATLEQPQGGNALYYVQDPHPNGLLIRNPAHLKTYGVSDDLLVAESPEQRVLLMGQLGGIHSNTLTSRVLLELSRGPKTKRHIQDRLRVDHVHLANVLNERVRGKLPLFGLEHRTRDVGDRVGVGRLQEHQLTSLPIQWELSKEIIDAEHAVVEFFNSRWNAFIGVAKKVLKDSEKAEDLVQSVCVRMLLMARRDPRNIREKLTFSYLSTALFHSSISEIRGTKREHVGFEEAEEAVYNRSDLFPKAKTPDALVGALEIRTLLQRVLKEVDLGIYRDAFERHYIDGISGVEIAKELGVPPGTVYSRFSKARTKIRERLVGLDIF